MDKQEAAEILIEQAQLEENPELAEAMKMGAQALQSDDLYQWVKGDLRDWLKS